MWAERIKIAERKGMEALVQPDARALVHRALPRRAAGPR